MAWEDHFELLHAPGDGYADNYIPEGKRIVKTESIMDRAERLERQANDLKKKAKRERKRLERFGPEPEMDSVLAFEKTFGVSKSPYPSSINHSRPVTYRYAAIRTPIGWVLTGKHHPWPMNYQELIDFIGDSPCRHAVAWDQIQ